MKTITGLTDQANQQMSIVLPDGTPVTLIMNFYPQQNAWFFDLSWQGISTPFTLLGCQMVTSPNLLRQFRKLLTFGLAVFTIDNVEAENQTAFVDGTATLVLLTAAEVEEIETAVYPGL